jgi:enterochelin esterase-like enzyme
MGVVVGGPDGYQMVSSYPAPAEATRKAGVPKATLDTFVYTSPTIFGAGQSGPIARNVSVFIPAQYVPNTEVPFIVLHDGDEQLRAFHTDIVLENLIFQKKLPVMAALFVNRPNSNDSRQRSLEYDCIDSDYSDYMIEEILPAVKMHHPELNLTSDPNGRATLGKSSGAVAAFTMAWLHPELYQRVVTFNGSFRNQCGDGPGAMAYPDMIRAAQPAKPLRLYVFSGSGDNAGYAAANQAMADAFKARGLPWRYDYGQGATHDNMYASSRVAEALLWIWAGYPL